MNELQEFNFQGNQLRTVMIDSEPFLWAKTPQQRLDIATPERPFETMLKPSIKGRNESLPLLDCNP